MSRSATHSSRACLWALAVLALTCLTFRRRQNRPGTLGGPISVPKTLWLNHTLGVFFVVPFFLWRNRTLPPSARRRIGLLLAGFTLRGAVEMALIYGTRRWRCIHGIAHNFFTLGLTLGLFARSTQQRDHAERRLEGFLPLYGATLMTESYMAWRFWQVAEPADGIYFAAPGEERFRRINRLTWGALAVLVPWLGGYLHRTYRDFSGLP